MSCLPDSQTQVFCQFLDIVVPSDSDDPNDCSITNQYPDVDDLSGDHQAHPSSPSHLDISFEDPFEHQFNADSDALDFFGLSNDFDSPLMPPSVGSDL